MLEQEHASWGVARARCGLVKVSKKVSKSPSVPRTMFEKVKATS